MGHYLIVGNGVAGTTAAENIREQDPEGAITIVTEEETPFYYRIRLNDYLSGELSEKELIARDESWYEQNRIELRLTTRITGADAAEKILIAEDQETFSFDSLLIATGSHSFVPPIKGSDTKGVFTLRSLEDARKLASWSSRIGEVVLIGGGLLGLEAGNALVKSGKKVTVVEFFPRLLPRQLDVEGAKRLQGIMENMGFSFRLGAKTEEIMGTDGVSGVRLEGGDLLKGGMAVISAGIRPNLELAEALALEKDKGIKVDEHLQTSLSGVYAAGDVAEFNGVPYGIWPAAMEQGKIAGINMGGGDAAYQGTTMANTLKVGGIDLASAGNIDAENKLESKVVKEEEIYKKIVFENNRVVGCIMLGDTKGFRKITRAMSEQQDVSQMKDQLL
jgi:nitrite reductase (NADH) large subunit